MNDIATLKGLRCPHCGSEQLKVTGTKGALGAALATGAAFGAIGNMVAGSSAKSNLATEPLQYKCTACKKKFTALPLLAEAQDVLPAPCNVAFTREKSFVGAVVPQIAYLNGVKLGAVKNGQTIHFTTSSRYNVMYVTDQYGVAFKSEFNFEAQPGGNIGASFKRKFLDAPNNPAFNPQPVSMPMAAVAPTPIPAPMPSAVPTPIPAPMTAAASPQPFARVQAAQVQSQPPMNAPAPEKSAAPQVRFCTNCGAALKDVAMFCPECGTKRFSD